LLSVFQEVTGRTVPLTQEEIKQLRGLPLKQVIKYLKIRSWQIPKLPKAIGQLQRDGYKMYILSTNSPANIEKFLKANDINDCFVDIYGDIGLRGKAAGLKKLIKRQKLAKALCLYIGDEVRDIEAARKVGIKVVAVGWGFNSSQALKMAQPNAVILKPNQLLEVVAK
jgi:phosphoglycolate phosphatase